MDSTLFGVFIGVSATLLSNVFYRIGNKFMQIQKERALQQERFIQDINNDMEKMKLEMQNNSRNVSSVLQFLLSNSAGEKGLYKTGLAVCSGEPKDFIKSLEESNTQACERFKKLLNDISQRTEEVVEKKEIEYSSERIPDN